MTHIISLVLAAVILLCLSLQEGWVGGGRHPGRTSCFTLPQHHLEQQVFSQTSQPFLLCLQTLVLTVLASGSKESSSLALLASWGRLGVLVLSPRLGVQGSLDGWGGRLGPISLDRIKDGRRNRSSMCSMLRSSDPWTTGGILLIVWTY